jgi:hypothetical protein
MSRAGVRPEIAERVLNHVISGVQGVYDRRDYAAEKRAALDALVSRIIDPSLNVVDLAAHRSPSAPSSPLGGQRPLLRVS